MTLVAALVLPAAAHAERAWLPPERLTPEGIAGQVFDVAVGPEGSVAAVWVERGSGKLPLYATVRGPGGVGATRVLLDDDTNGGVTLAANAAGDMIAAWQEAADPYAIKVARRLPGALAFSAPQALEDSSRRTTTDALVSLDALGNAVIAHAGDHVDWEDPRPLDVLAWYAPVGAPFGAPRRLIGSAELRSGWVGDVALLPTQEAVLIYDDFEDDRSDAHVRAVTWQANAADGDAAVTTLARTGGPVPMRKQVEADPLGRVTALWTQGSYGPGAGVLVRHRAPGAAFGPAFRIDAPGGADALQHPLELSVTGELLTAWSPDYYDDAGTIVTSPFGTAPGAGQPVPGHPRSIAGGGGPEGDLVVLGHTAPGSYGQRLVTARRVPGSKSFTRVRDAVAGCRVLSNWTKSATGLDGTGAILSQDPAQGLWLLVDAPTVERPARGCLDASAYDPLAEDAVEPPVDLPEVDPVTGLPKPPVVKPPVVKPSAGAALEPVIEGVRVRRSGGAQVVTFSVRCRSCTTQASGRLLARRAVLARAKQTSRARSGTARVTLRFRPSRRARSAARGPRRFAIDVRVSDPGAPAAVRRLSVPAR